MKKKIAIMVLSVISCIVALSLVVFFKSGILESRAVNGAIAETNQYLQEQEVSKNYFGCVLQEKLDSSLVYNIDVDEFLIIYKNKWFIYKNNKVDFADNVYEIYENVEQALANAAVGKIVLTKGYYYENDGGNSIFQVFEYFTDSKTINISNAEKTKTLKYMTHNSVVSLFQMGYKSGDINNHINNFTARLEYANIFVPKGKYRVSDNFDVNVSNKSYMGYQTILFADDTYLPVGASNGCLFYVFNNISNIKINGFDVVVYVNKKLNDPLIGFMTARDVDGVFVNNCSFFLPEEAAIYQTSGMVDLFTGWKNVTVKNCRLENHSSTFGGGGIGVRDIFKKECKNALFENNYIYSNCKDEVVAIFSGLDTSLIEDNVGGGNIENVTFKNNTIVGGKYDKNSQPRAVGITVGYQVSPVKDVKFINNDITMYSANYLMLYGKTTDLTMEGNIVSIDSSYQNELYILFYHNVYAQEAFNIVVKNNTFKMMKNSTIKTISQTGVEFSFDGNLVESDYSVNRLLNSKSTYTNNVFNFAQISGCVYRDILIVINNTINVDQLNVVYEFFDLNLKNDVLIDSDTINANSIGANLMMFNGSQIYFNNHTVTFNNFKFYTNVVFGLYYYLAYDTSAVKDVGVINFVHSDISVYQDDAHNFIARNESERVKVNFIG